MNITRSSEKIFLAAALATLVACKSNESRPVEPAAEAAPASQAAQSTPAQPVASPVAAASDPGCQDKAARDKAAKGKVVTKKPAAKTAKGKAAAKAEAKAEIPACPEDGSQATGKAAGNAARTQAAGEGTEPAPKISAPAAAGAYNLSGNKPVTDSTKVQAGEGTKVKGVNDWEGEITGLPAANSRFTRLKIGMSLQQAIDLAGAPTDQGAYVTGKAFIPFYFGSDKTRWEAVYKGQGRLIFANQAGFGTGQYLVWIIHNSNEPGYR